ncbi:leucyl/phenylalanyl-tRNA--protein transferase [Pedobacter glucosidilyticus]|uniref:leucyl/phenylalanyl-tRNA--protein transferase n=1 Tax=Pedobacter glucosidilyticus TaxID=1122941 RepID=UPI00041CF42C|nr:leucyl/phenylalanyl-tRNA--protein transferase [Pedobacter glucosidilyticus]
MIFELSEDLVFPNPAHAEEDGLLAVGGDLSVERLLLAYSHGIFPWFNDDTPILWYAPHERFVLFPDEIKISKSMKQVLKRQEFQISLNKAFADVITACATINRDGQDGTWITTDMQAAYIKLHEKGYAHAVEVWKDEKLVGGLYGVLINGVFCGESMFARVSNASKMALIWLCQNLELKLIDCQVHTAHLESMGARMIDRESYLKILQS